MVPVTGRRDGSGAAAAGPGCNLVLCRRRSTALALLLLAFFFVAFKPIRLKVALDYVSRLQFPSSNMIN